MTGSHRIKSGPNCSMPNGIMHKISRHENSLEPYLSTYRRAGLKAPCSSHKKLCPKTFKCESNSNVDANTNFRVTTTAPCNFVQELKTNQQD